MRYIIAILLSGYSMFTFNAYAENWEHTFFNSTNGVSVSVDYSSDLFSYSLNNLHIHINKDGLTCDDTVEIYLTKYIKYGYDYNSYSSTAARRKWFERDVSISTSTFFTKYVNPGHFHIGLKMPEIGLVSYNSTYAGSYIRYTTYELAVKINGVWYKNKEGLDFKIIE